MSPWLILGDVLAWAAQIVIVVGFAALASYVAPVSRAPLRLAYWQLVLAACVLLPVVQPWHSPVIRVTAGAPVAVQAQNTTAAAARWAGISLDEALLWVLAGGVVLRLLWLAVGCVRLALYRRRAVPLPGYEGLLQTADVTSPVTFGIFRRVVLVPAEFFDHPAEVQRAVLCHEFLHVRRRDALWTLLEQCAGALLWFHPAVWWVLGRIRLSREQAVDEEAVRLLGTRDAYVAALLAAAGSGMQFDAAPAASFMRRRHLLHRVSALMEVQAMSIRRMVAALSVSAAVIALAAALAVRSFPLQAAPQVQGAQGASTFTIETPVENIRIDTGGATTPYPPRAVYPPGAREKKVEGTVFLQLRIGSGGEVIDAVVQSGPDELRAASLQSALLWRFGKESAGKTVQASIDYRLPNPSAAPRVGVRRTLPPPPPPAPGAPVRIQIDPQLPQPVRDLLTATLKSFEGQPLSDDLMRRIAEHVKPVLPVANYRYNTDGSVFISGGTPDAGSGGAEAQGRPAGAPTQIRVGGQVQAAKLTNYGPPEYPPLARQARIQGIVRFNAVINKDGTIGNLTLVSGHPLLVPAAQQSVRGYVYQQTLLNGEPVEVLTTIEVPFTLPPE